MKNKYFWIIGISIIAISLFIFLPTNKTENLSKIDENVLSQKEMSFEKNLIEDIPCEKTWNEFEVVNCPKDNETYFVEIKNSENKNCNGIYTLNTKCEKIGSRFEMSIEHPRNLDLNQNMIMIVEEDENKKYYEGMGEIENYFKEKLEINNEKEEEKSEMRCLESCESNNPFAKGICDETTNYECIFEEATCGEKDNICPSNGEYTELDGGCYNSDDSDCSLIFSYDVDQNYACGNSYNFRQFTFKDNNFFWLNNEYSINNPEPTTKDYDLEGEIINTLAVDSSNIYFGTDQNKILAYNRDNTVKDYQININDFINTESNQNVWLIYVDEDQLYIGISHYGILIFSTKNQELVNEISFNEMLFFVDKNYIYADEDSHISIYKKNDFNKIADLDTTLEKSKFGSNDDYFVNIEKGVDSHYYLKIWNKDNWQIHKKIDLGVRIGNIFVSDEEIFIGGSSSEVTERFIKKYNFDGELQEVLWGNHGKYAIPIHASNNNLIVFTQVTKEGGSGTCLFLQNWKK